MLAVLLVSDLCIEFNMPVSNNGLDMSLLVASSGIKLAMKYKHE